MTVTAYKCTLCKKLSESGFMVSITAANRFFSFGEAQQQDTFRLEICSECLDQLPAVVRSALH